MGASGGRTCPACGRAIDRRESREYDKHGAPWALRGKTYEYLCPACFDELDHRPRDGLEATLVDIDAGGCDDGAFLRRFLEATGDDRGRTDDRSYR